MKLFLRSFVLLASIALFALGLPATAGHRGADRVMDRIVVGQTGLTAEDAAEMVQARTGGRVLAVKRIRSNGRLVYRVKVLTRKGEVRIFYVDAATGAM